MVLVLSLFFFIFKYFSLEVDILNKQLSIKNVDITEPRFAINSPEQRIFVTAKEGNFIGSDKILLKKNVKFSSNQFSIESDFVTFDRKEQTARSDKKSIFKTNNTTISSEGFNIYDNGNKIEFYGHSKVILK